MRAVVFRLCLALCPRAFRARFGDEVLDTARTLDRERPLRLTDAPRVVIDAVTTLRAVRREMRVESLRGPLESSRAAPPDRSRRVRMDGLWLDVRIAARGLRRDVAFTGFVVAALTLGIGANAAMFGIVDRLLLTGPPYIHDPARVVRLYMTTQPAGMRRFTSDGFGNVLYDLARRQSTTFDGLATCAVDDVIVGDGEAARTMRGGYASATLFPMLGVQPAFGRFFRDDENSAAGAAAVVVISEPMWHSAFGARRDAIGQVITVGNDRLTVIGVAPRGFTGPEQGEVDLWLPMNLRSVHTAPNWQTTWSAQWLEIVGRVKAGVSARQAGDELTSILHRQYSGDEPYVATGTMTVAPLSANDEGVEAPEVTVVRWMTGVTIIVLLIACANVANLLLARGVRRAREIALRSALGAGTGRLVRLLVVESMLLAAAGATGGIAVAYALGGVARRLVFSWVDWSTSPVDAGVLAASAVLAIATGLVVGILPAWRVVVGARTTDALKTGARDGRGPRSTMRHALTTAQAALSVVLLIGAGLFVRSLWNVWTLPLGLDPDRVLIVDISRPPLGRIADPTARAAEQTRRRSFSGDAVGAIRALPGVEAASAAVGLPFGNRFTMKLRVPGLVTVPRLKTGGPSVSAVAADYFSTVGTRILRGRPFESADRQGSEAIAIVNETMAKTIWPGQDAIGQCIITGNDPAPCARIVGIAEDTHQSALREPPTMHYYIPFGQEVGFGGTVIVVRAADPGRLGPAVRRAIVDRDPTIRFVQLRTMAEAIAPETASWRVGATVFSLSGLLALVVAAIGLYSVMSYLVADRTHEIGVRLALGARPSDVAALILRGSVGMAAIGVAVGMAGAMVASRTIESLLFDESARDPWVYGAVALTLLVVALGAGIVPTIRAGRIEPLRALWDE